jgi:hypothetical protein
LYDPNTHGLAKLRVSTMPSNLLASILALPQQLES